MLLRGRISLVRRSANSLFLGNKLSTYPIRRTAHEGAFRCRVRGLSATGTALAVSSLRARRANARRARRLNGCNLPREMVRLVKHGTSTGRRLAKTISPDSPTEGLGQSDSVPAGHRYQAVGDTRFSGARKRGRPDSQVAGAIEWKGSLAFFPAYTVEIDDHDDQTAGNDPLPERIDVHQVRAIGDGGQNEGTKYRSMHRTDGAEQTCTAYD